MNTLRFQIYYDGDFDMQEEVSHYFEFIRDSLFYYNCELYFGLEGFPLRNGKFAVEVVRGRGTYTNIIALAKYLTEFPDFDVFLEEQNVITPNWERMIKKSIQKVHNSLNVENFS